MQLPWDDMGGMAGGEIDISAVVTGEETGHTADHYA